MKIIQIIDVRWYNASADFAVTQALALANRGHEILLMVNPGSPPADKAREKGLEVSEKIDFSKSNIFGSAGKLAEIAAKFKPDIVFAHRGESHLVAAITSKRTGFKVARFRGDVRPPRRNIFSRILNEKLTKGIAVSTARLKQEYEKRYRLNGIPVRVIYPGIDSVRFEHGAKKEELKKEFGLNPAAPVIGMVGRLSPVKGHEYFLKASRRVFERFPGVQFVVAGGDAQLSAEQLKRNAAEMGLGNIVFLGEIENIDRLISALDIGVVASTGSEMICRVLMEYFAAGIPVVATEINQVYELMSISKGGIVVPPGNSDAMGDALIDLLNDDIKSAELSKAGKSWARNDRSLEALAMDSESFLERVNNE
ncbi:MAG: glycosyltransferase family 4 protein [candidate division Zixibacteria bacterium]